MPGIVTRRSEYHLPHDIGYYHKYHRRHIFGILVIVKCHVLKLQKVGRGSSVRSSSVLYADGRGIDPHVRQHSFVEIGQEIISTAILSLPLIQEVQLSVTGETMCTRHSVVTCLGGLARNSVNRLNDRARNDLRGVEGP